MDNNWYINTLRDQLCRIMSKAELILDIATDLYVAVTCGNEPIQYTDAVDIARDIAAIAEDMEQYASPPDDED